MFPFYLGQKPEGLKKLVYHLGFEREIQVFKKASWDWSSAIITHIIEFPTMTSRALVVPYHEVGPYQL